jgi:natural product precursor
MKKNIQFNKKALSLNKETVAKLNDEQLKNIAGGKYDVKAEEDSRFDISCWSGSCNTKVAA